MNEDEINGRVFGPDRPLQQEAFAAPALERSPVVVVDEPELVEAWQFIAACERCMDVAFLSFDYLLEAVMEGDPDTQYLMWRTVTCPSCGNDIHEKSRIVPRRG